MALLQAYQQTAFTCDLNNRNIRHSLTELAAVKTNEYISGFSFNIVVTIEETINLLIIISLIVLVYKILHLARLVFTDCATVPSRHLPTQCALLGSMDGASTSADAMTDLGINATSVLNFNPNAPLPVT